MRLEDILEFQNPWWRTGKVDADRLGSFKRQMLETALSQLKEEKVVSIIGPRRVGKTVMIHQMIQKLIDNGTQPNRIVYLQLDNPDIIKEGIINNLMEFVSHSLGAPLYEMKEPVFIFLDEVHKLRSWGEEVKHWNDLKLKIKFVVTGSSAVRILKGSGESLLGRITHNLLFPLSFREFLKIKYELDVAPFGIWDMEKEYYKLAKHAQKIQIALQDYILRGGYPAVIDDEISKVFQTLLEYKDLSLQRDVFEEEEIREGKTLNELVILLADLVGSKISYNKLGGLLLSRVNTIKRYLDMLESIYFIREMSAFRNKYSSIKYGKKIVFLDNGMMNSLNMDYSLKKMPQAAENAVCSAVYRKMTGFQLNPSLQFWSNGSEVDCIYVEKSKTFPIEIKFQAEIGNDDIKGLLEFMEKFKTDGIVASKNTFEKRRINGKHVAIAPLWLVLLALG